MARQIMPAKKNKGRLSRPRCLRCSLHASPMLLHNLTLLLLVVYTSNAFCAVLTATTNVYIPLNHGITRPADENGVLSFVGGDNGITTFILTEPQNAEARVTLVVNDDFVIYEASVGTNEVLSLSCAKQAADAVCLIFNSNPADHLFAFSTTTDTPLDSVALLEIGLPTPPTPTPAPTPAPAPAPAPQPSSNPASPSAGGNQNGAGGGGTGGTGGTVTSNSPTSTPSSQQTQTGDNTTTGSTRNSPSDISSQSNTETQPSQSAPASILPGLPPVGLNNSNQGISPGMPPSGAMRLAIDVFRSSVLSFVAMCICSLF